MSRIHLKFVQSNSFSIFSVHTKIFPVPGWVAIADGTKSDPIKILLLWSNDFISTSMIFLFCESHAYSVSPSFDRARPINSSHSGNLRSTISFFSARDTTTRRQNPFSWQSLRIKLPPSVEATMPQGRMPSASTFCNHSKL